VKAKLFQTLTSEVNGDPTIHPQPEHDWGNVNPIGPRSCYDEGKRCAETLFFDYRRQHELRVKVARIFNTYGPRMHPNDGRVVSNFIVQALHRFRDNSLSVSTVIGRRKRRYSGGHDDGLGLCRPDGQHRLSSRKHSGANEFAPTGVPVMGNNRGRTLKYPHKIGLAGLGAPAFSRLRAPGARCPRRVTCGAGAKRSSLMHR
jgi:hypothetical protein